MRSFLIGLFLLVQGSVLAQAPLQQFTADSLVSRLTWPEKMKPTWLVVKQSARENRLLLRSGVVLASASGVGLATFRYGDEPVREFTLENRSQVTHAVSKVIEPMGRSQYLMPASGVLLLTGLAFKDQRLQRAAWLTFLSLNVNDLVTGQLKDEFQRRRPDVAQENNEFEWGEGGQHHASMPSSHTSTAFTAATSLATVYHDNPVVPPLAYAAATLVGLSRIHDNVHWATDVLAGAAVGFASAKVSHFLLLQTENLLKRKNIRLYLAPKVNLQQAGLSAGLRF